MLDAEVEDGGEAQETQQAPAEGDVVDQHPYVRGREHHHGDSRLAGEGGEGICFSTVDEWHGYLTD